MFTRITKLKTYGKICLMYNNNTPILSKRYTPSNGLVTR